MKIDSSVDAAMREALTAAGSWDRERFDRAVEAIMDHEGDFAEKSVSLAIAVGSIALYLVHGQEWPDQERVDELAGAYSSEQTWAAIDPAVVKSYLRAIMTEQADQLNEISPEVFPRAVFALTAWLLTGFQLPEGIAWSDFLDEIEDEIETRTP